MSVAKGQIYSDREVEGRGGLVEVTDVRSGKVEFFPIGGGFVTRCPLEKFQESFKLAVADLIDPAGIVYERIRVWVDECWESLPAWTNGDLWNGFEEPLFECEAVEAGIANGTFDHENVHVEVLDDGVFFVQTESGETIPEGIDWSSIIAELRAGGTVSAREITPDVLIYASIVRPVTIEADGREFEVFEVGVGWCWSRDDEPTESPAP